MNKPATKRSQEAAVSKEELSKKIAAARLDLNTLLLTGESTTTARAALRALEDEQCRFDAAAADQHAAQQALAQIESDRIAEAAATIKEARDSRIAAIATRFAIPARPVFDSRDDSTLN
ncbi:hypothetical protein [Paraburkholderia aromaticivorans]|uniref:hypothetical protein n=1 Tax=Paraburkholderia aromaticivorans TaxID=2026199 RepID=UPI001456025D|nr:hypothetical protein [Paraburkholderia aromaticivorans]